MDHENTSSRSEWSADEWVASVREVLDNPHHSEDELLVRLANAVISLRNRAKDQQVADAERERSWQASLALARMYVVGEGSLVWPPEEKP